MVGELERELGGAYIEVMNFAVTGYGPNQYMAILTEYVPLFHPDIIMIGFFMNDFEDVQISDDRVPFFNWISRIEIQTAFFPFSVSRIYANIYR